MAYKVIINVAEGVYRGGDGFSLTDSCIAVLQAKGIAGTRLISGVPEDTSKKYTERTCYSAPADSVIRRDQEYIAVLEEFGLDKCSEDSGYAVKLQVVEIPAFCNYTITLSDKGETIEVQFPWEQLARAYMEGNAEDPVRVAVETGVLSVPKKA